MVDSFEENLRRYLKQYQTGKLGEKYILNFIKKNLYQERFQLIDNIARLERNRQERTGIAEVVFAEGKSYPSLKKIVFALLPDEQYENKPSTKHNIRSKKQSTNFLITRLEESRFKKLASDYFTAFKRKLPLIYHMDARIAHTDFQVLKKSSSKKNNLVHVAIVSAGTSDLAVAEECAVTLGCWNVAVKKYYDVGVAALGRLLGEVDNINRAQVIVVIAGMEAALASVLGGLVRPPIIAVPTSVGYGSHMKGVTALLGMLNGCAPGMAVVNIDNGFGAAAMAFKILHTQKLKS